MVDLKNTEDCCGCTACIEICPQKCITKKDDENGFMYPYVNSEECKKCGLCEKVCPILNQQLHESKKYFVGYAEEEEVRKAGSSGGIFGAIARDVIRQGGIVYGAGFNKDLQLICMSAETEEELVPLYRSKYIQCNMHGCYSKIKRVLDQNRRVLFCSSPCNCQALKNYLKDSYENLLIVDFVCHGVSSQRLFDESITYYEEIKEDKAEKFDFRCKEHHLNCSRVFQIVMHKNTYKDIYLNFPYYYYYMNYISFRSSCYSCLFATSKRASDITMGDYHMPQVFFPKENRLSGFSSILCNTGKGLTTIENLPLKLIETTKEEIIKYNASLETPSGSKEWRNFQEDYKRLTFEELLKRYKYFSARTRVKIFYYKMPRTLQSVMRRVLVRE